MFDISGVEMVMCGARSLAAGPWGVCAQCVGEMAGLSQERITIFGSAASEPPPGGERANWKILLTIIALTVGCVLVVVIAVYQVFVRPLAHEPESEYPALAHEQGGVSPLNSIGVTESDRLLPTAGDQFASINSPRGKFQRVYSSHGRSVSQIGRVFSEQLTSRDPHLSFEGSQSPGAQPVSVPGAAERAVRESVLSGVAASV